MKTFLSAVIAVGVILVVIPMFYRLGVATGTKIKERMNNTNGK